MDRFVTDLTGGEWAATEPLIPPHGRMGRRRGPDMREVFNAVLFIPGTGCRWRAVPKCFPPFTSIRNHFHAWRDSGVPERMPDALNILARELENCAVAPTATAVDSRTVKTTEMGGP